MTENERKDLGVLKKTLEEIATTLKTWHDKGVVINFGLNGAAGTVDNFRVQQLVDLDIETEAN